MISHIDTIVARLRRAYPSLPLMELTGGHPFKTLVATILSQRSKDETTIRIATLLFATVGDTPDQFLRLSPAELSQLIFASGFYQQKAAHILRTASILVSRYHGKVPRNREDLLTLPGVGRKTANIVLSNCFNIPAIAVDVHVHRISNRLGWITTKTPVQSEYALMSKLPRKYWSLLNGLLVRHGQEVCKPVLPQCWRCPIQRYCRFPKKNRAKKGV